MLSLSNGTLYSVCLTVARASGGGASIDACVHTRSIAAPHHVCVLTYRPLAKMKWTGTRERTSDIERMQHRYERTTFCIYHNTALDSDSLELTNSSLPCSTSTSVLQRMCNI
jgi:hypothetical protein